MSDTQDSELAQDQRDGAKHIASVGPHAGRGRPRDPARHAAILDATIEVLTETGYAGLTVDLVAARAGAGKATLYRRWPSKLEMVVEAVGCLADGGDVDLGALPDSGTLRDDLVEMIGRPRWARDGGQRLKVMAGLMSVVSQAPELVTAVSEAIVEPSVAANRLLIRRAVERGEASAECDIELLAHVAPSMAAYRLLVLQRPVDRAFLERIIDAVIVPAATGRGPDTA